MLLNIGQIIQLATALQPLVAGGIVGVQHIVGAIKGAVPDAEIDAAYTQLIAEALQAKAEADRAASGHDSR